MKLGSILQGLFVATMAITATGARAQADFPQKPIHIIVPFTSGSGADAQARLYSKLLQEDLKQPVIVENKPGANGALGLEYVKNQPADGYTISIGGTFQVVNPVLMKGIRYKPSDFRPIAGLFQGSIGLLVGATSPYHSVADLIADARAKNRSLSIATYTGTYRLAAVLLSQVASVQVTDVPYKGAGQVVTDLIGGHVEAAMVDLNSQRALLQEGKIRALAVTTAKRLPDFPDVPTLTESFPDYKELLVWTSMIVRAETPDPIIKKLAASMKKALESKDTAEYVKQFGFDPIMAPADEVYKFQQEQFERVKEIARRANITAQ